MFWAIYYGIRYRLNLITAYGHYDFDTRKITFSETGVNIHTNLYDCTLCRAYLDLWQKCRYKPVIPTPAHFITFAVIHREITLRFVKNGVFIVFKKKD